MKGKWLLLVGLLATFTQAAEPIVPLFSAGVFGEWKKQGFDNIPPTQYDLVKDHDRSVLHAQSQAAASGLFFKHPVDLEKIPVMTWSWKVDRLFDPLAEQTKPGDDYAARIYVVFKTKWNQIKPCTLVYVWSSRDDAPAHYRSPYTDKGVMIPMNRGRKELGNWQSHRRNVQADIEKHFGKRVKKLIAVAIMTDADNSSQHAEAWYGDVQFLPEQVPAE